MTGVSDLRRGEKALLAALVVFSVVNVLCWIHIVPLADAPDEPSHFEVVAFELVFHRIPEVGVDDFGARVKIARDGYRSPLYTYSAQPGLSYIVSAAAIELLGDRSPESVIFGRYPGLVWAALMPLVVFWGVARMIPTRRDAAALAAIASALWPQLTFVFCCLNNDGLTTLVCAALVASWYSGARSGWRRRDALVTGVLIGLVVLNKPNGFPVAAATALAAALTFRGGLRAFSVRCGQALGAAFAVAGWWYVIAFRRYGLDLLADRRAGSILDTLGVEWASGRHYGMTLMETAIAPFPRSGESWVRGTLTSAVGRFGELTIPLPDAVYGLTGAIAILAFIGSGIVALRARGLSSEDRRLARLHAVTFALIPLEFILALYRSWAFDFQAQGRYLFPVLLPFFALLGIGIVGPMIAGFVRRGAGLVASVLFAAIGFHAFAVTLLDAYRLSLVELLAERPILGGAWVGAAISVSIVIAAYWVRGRDSE